MKRYTAAIVGCGSIGNAHMEGYNLVDEVEVIAVADPVAMARKTYVAEYGIPQEFETVEEMMEKARPNIVSVCTWHLLHPAPTIAAAEGGARAVICEKPMAIGMAAADSMVDSCRANGTQLVISHQRRFTPGWEKAKALVEDGAIGEPIFVTNKVADGLTNWGTHSIDGSRFVLGDPPRPMGHGRSRAPHRPLRARHHGRRRLYGLGPLRRRSPAFHSVRPHARGGWCRPL